MPSEIFKFSDISNTFFSTKPTPITFKTAYLTIIFKITLSFNLSLTTIHSLINDLTQSIDAYNTEKLIGILSIIENEPTLYFTDVNFIIISFPNNRYGLRLYNKEID